MSDSSTYFRLAVAAADDAAEMRAVANQLEAEVAGLGEVLDDARSQLTPAVWESRVAGERDDLLREIDRRLTAFEDDVLEIAAALRIEAQTRENDAARYRRTYEIRALDELAATDPVY